MVFYISLQNLELLVAPSSGLIIKLKG